MAGRSTVHERKQRTHGHSSHRRGVGSRKGPPDRGKCVMLLAMSKDDKAKAKKLKEKADDISRMARILKRLSDEQRAKKKDDPAPRRSDRQGSY